MRNSRLKITKYTYLDSNDLSLRVQCNNDLFTKKNSLVIWLTRGFVLQILVVTAVIALIFCVYGEIFSAAMSRFQKSFIVHNIVVSGNDYFSREEILNLAALQEEIHVTDIDLISVKREMEALARIKRVQLKISLPSAMQIVVDESKPAAVWYDLEKYHIVNDEGVILEEDIDFQAIKNQYLLVIGESGNKHFSDLLRELNGHDIISSLYAVQFVGNRRWNFLLRDGTIVKMPEGNMLVALDVFNAILQNYAEAESFNIVDLRLAPNKVYGSF